MAAIEGKLSHARCVCQLVGEPHALLNSLVIGGRLQATNATDATDATAANTTLRNQLNTNATNGFQFDCTSTDAFAFADFCARTSRKTLETQTLSGRQELNSTDSIRTSFYATDSDSFLNANLRLGRAAETYARTSLSGPLACILGRIRSAPLQGWPYTNATLRNSYATLTKTNLANTADRQAGAKTLHSTKPGTHHATFGVPQLRRLSAPF